MSNVVIPPPIVDPVCSNFFYLGGGVKCDYDGLCKPAVQYSKTKAGTFLDSVNASTRTLRPMGMHRTCR